MAYFKKIMALTHFVFLTKKDHNVLFFFNSRSLHDSLNSIRDLLDISKITVKRWVDEDSGNIKVNKRRGRLKGLIYLMKI